MTTESILAQAALLKLRIKLTMAVDPIIQTMKAINHFIPRVMGLLYNKNRDYNCHA